MFAGEESNCEADIFFRKAWCEQVNRKSAAGTKIC